MARISRFTLKVFGDSGPTTDFAQYGSFKAGTALKIKDPVTIQSLTAWLTGLKGCVLDGNKAAPLEDINSVLYIHSAQVAYNLQEGVPEWDAGTAYYKWSIVKKPGTFELYGSLTDGNVGQALPSQANNTNWQFLNPQPEPVGTVKMFAGSTAVVPFGYLLCDGSAVSRASFSALFALIGTAYGAGNGSTTFNLPDMAGRVPIGQGAGAGLTNRNLGDKPGAESNTVPHTHSIPESSVQHKHQTQLLFKQVNSELVGIGSPFGQSASGPGAGYGVAGFSATAVLGAGNGYAYELTDVMYNYANGATGTSSPSVSTIQPSLALNFIIKT